MKLIELKDQLEGEFPLGALRPRPLKDGTQKKTATSVSTQIYQAPRIRIRDMTDEELDTETLKFVEFGTSVHVTEVENLYNLQKQLREAHKELVNCDALEAYTRLSEITALALKTTDLFKGLIENSNQELMWALPEWVKETTWKSHAVIEKIIQEQKRVDPESRALRVALGGDSQKWCLIKPIKSKVRDYALETLYLEGSMMIVPSEAAERHKNIYINAPLKTRDPKTLETLKVLLRNSQLPLKDIVEMAQALEEN